MDTHLPTVLRPRSDLAWVVDANHVIIAEHGGTAARVLSGTEATVWSWLTRSPAADRLVEFVAALENVDRRTASRRTSDLLDSWIDAGLLVPLPDATTGNGDG